MTTPYSPPVDCTGPRWFSVLLTGWCRRGAHYVPGQRPLCSRHGGPALLTQSACICGHDERHHVGILYSAGGRYCQWRGCGCPQLIDRGAAEPHPSLSADSAHSSEVQT